MEGKNIPVRLTTVTCGFLLLFCSGCSTLGLSLYPSGSVLTEDAEALLESTRTPTGVPRENAKTVLPPHVLEPGDTVLIDPVNLQQDLQLPSDQTVLADGTVDLGPYGRVVVAGSSLEQAESLIEQQIAQQIQSQAERCQPYRSESSDTAAQTASLPDDFDSLAVNVRLLDPVHRFYVLGEVNAPGAYPLSGFETVLDAIVTAGGLTSSADPCSILLARPSDPCECRTTLPVCYREIVQMGNASTNYQLQPGDRVFVASRSCLDDLLFWRGRQACDHCAGCNKPCRYPDVTPDTSRTIVPQTMIPPGSLGLLSQSEEAASVANSSGISNEPTVAPRLDDNDPLLRDYLNPESKTGGPDAANPSGLDGELELPLLDE